MNRAEVIESVCAALIDYGKEAAAVILDREYPFVPSPGAQRRFRAVEYVRVFIRDGFLDRYTGDRLVFPPVLRMLSHAFPDRFPYHPNWKTAATHPAYWQLAATIDHLQPVTRGGVDGPQNWLTTSMIRNCAKMNGTIAELGWQVVPAGDYRRWDGLMGWCLRYAHNHPDVARDRALRHWLRAATVAVAEVDRLT